jgi:hypothetical protein
MASVLSLRQRPQVTPSPPHVLSRLQQLRAAIFNPPSPPPSSSPAPPQALLLIGGVDGKFNVGSRRALAFLLGGAVGDEVATLPQLDDVIDDVFALITLQHVFFCCNSNTFESIKHLILCWPGLHLTVTPPPTPADPDAGEDQKAAAFICAVEHVGAVAVPLTSNKAWFGEHAGQWRADVMQVEQWPLVQVFAMQELGSKGFFSMIHPITDASPALNPLYGHVDPHALTVLAEVYAPLFAYHFWNSTSALDCTPANRSSVTECALADPLISLLEHGSLRDDIHGISQEPKIKHAGAYIGPRTSCLPGTKCIDTPPSGSHAILYGSDPFCPLAACRTLFLNSGGAAAALPPKTHDDAGLEPWDDGQASSLQVGGCGFGDLSLGFGV